MFSILKIFADRSASKVIKKTVQCCSDVPSASAWNRTSKLGKNKNYFSSMTLLANISIFFSFLDQLSVVTLIFSSNACVLFFKKSQLISVNYSKYYDSFDPSAHRKDRTENVIKLCIQIFFMPLPVVKEVVLLYLEFHFQFQSLHIFSIRTQYSQTPKRLFKHNKNEKSTNVVVEALDNISQYNILL